MESLMTEHTYSRTPLRPFFDIEREEIDCFLRDKAGLLGLSRPGPFFWRPPAPVGYPSGDHYSLLSSQAGCIPPQLYPATRAGSMMVPPHLLQQWANSPSSLTRISQYNMMLNDLNSTACPPPVGTLRPLPSHPTTTESAVNHRYMPYVYARKDQTNGSDSEIPSPTLR